MKLTRLTRASADIVQKAALNSGIHSFVKDDCPGDGMPTTPPASTSNQVSQKTDTGSKVQLKKKRESGMNTDKQQPVGQQEIKEQIIEVQQPSSQNAAQNVTTENAATTVQDPKKENFRCPTCSEVIPGWEILRTHCKSVHQMKYTELYKYDVRSLQVRDPDEVLPARNCGRKRKIVVPDDKDKRPRQSESEYSSSKNAPTVDPRKQGPETAMSNIDQLLPKLPRNVAQLISKSQMKCPNCSEIFQSYDKLRRHYKEQDHGTFEGLCSQSLIDLLVEKKMKNLVFFCSDSFTVKSHSPDTSTPAVITVTMPNGSTSTIDQIPNEKDGVESPAEENAVENVELPIFEGGANIGQEQANSPLNDNNDFPVKECPLCTTKSTSDEEFRTHVHVAHELDEDWIIDEYELGI